MSRCLPFPPPNYMKNGIGGEALLQQLELRRVKCSKEKEEEKKHKKKDKKSEEDDKKLRRSHEKKRRNDDKESENEDDSKRSDEKKKERRRRRKEQKHDVEKVVTHSEYTNLTMNWVPLEMQMVLTHLEHEDWLSRKNHSNGESERKTTEQTEHVGNRCCTDNGSCRGIQPFATYLPNADVYALPYVLPF
ncbi:unnamed protein product [Lathyrus sativus]|nr:unnamed protein product [Lathyrus sativus]